MNTLLEAVLQCLSAEGSPRCELHLFLVGSNQTKKLLAHSEERVWGWIRFNREENIDGPITGESGEGWRDGGRPKLRSISEAGEGKKSTKTQTHSEGRVLHPKTDVMISGLKKQNTPCIPVPKLGIVLFFHCVFHLCFAETLIVPPPLTTRFSPSFSLFGPAHEPPEAKSSESSSPLSTYNQADRTTVIHLVWAEGTVKQQWKRTHWNILWQQRLFSVTNNTAWPLK